MKKYFTLGITLCILILLNSCEKNYSSIGLNLRDDLLGNSYMDTTSLISFSLKDTINTKGLAGNVLGFVRDPVFGITEAGFYAQYLPSTQNITFENSAVLDSIVLSIRINGYFGDTLTPLKIRVYELDEEFRKDSNYYQFSSLNYINENLTFNPNYEVYPMPFTRIKVDTTMQDAQIRIRLSDELGERFMNNPDKLRDDNSFLNFFKGLLVKVEPTTGIGSLLYASLTSSLSGITIYYSSSDTISRRFAFLTKQDNAARFNYFNHYDYTSASSELQNQISGDQSLGETKLYLQSGGGIKTKLQFPNIKETFKEKNIIINRAELVITNISMDEDFFFQPPRIEIRGISAVDKEVDLPDRLNDQSGEYFGGTYDINKKEYRFRITRYIQQLILNDEYKDYIYLSVAAAGNRASRLLFAGPQADTSSRLRLEITYTTY